MARAYTPHQFQNGQSPLWLGVFGALRRQKFRSFFRVFKYTSVRCSLLPCTASKCVNSVAPVRGAELLRSNAIISRLTSVQQQGRVKNAA